MYGTLFSSDPPNILPCEGTGIVYKITVKLKVFAQPLHQVLLQNIVSFLTLVYQNKNELPGTSMEKKLKKSHCLLKSSVPLPWQPNLINTLPKAVISKLLIQTRGPILTYTVVNPVSLLWTWHFKHGVYMQKVFHFPH